MHMACSYNVFRQLLLLLLAYNVMVMCFQAEDGWFSRKCRKINHSTSRLSFIVPSFLNFSFIDDGTYNVVILLQKCQSIRCIFPRLTFIQNF